MQVFYELISLRVNRSWNTGVMGNIARICRESRFTRKGYNQYTFAN